MPSHRLVHPEVVKRLYWNAQLAPQWPSYTGVSTAVGTTADGRCTVYYDPSLSAAGLQNAQDLLADAPRVMAADDSLFATAGGPINVIVFALGGQTDGTGGADHMSCDFTNGQNIEVCASFGSSARVSALLEAERSECQMGGNLCGNSTGEALSRWCAMSVSNNALSDFATAPQWAADGMPNFVDTADPTDQNADSTGCGMAYLSWIMGTTSHTLSSVAITMVHLGDSGTLADLYYSLGLGVKSDAWTAFQNAIAALPAGITSDDPFNALGTPQPQPGPVPTPTPTPTPVPTPGPGVSGTQWAMLAVCALVAGVAIGETADQLKGDVDAIPTT